ncbi:succinylglutamate desuccinylase [Marinobacter zhejiangensis]|uniref:Succinylglutamate desuccinylase n=1 Tax=Marinobacter zhejiangensis TaxID=488535 RepID=A0A1I4KSQ9_9GAMM|nr:succinylglutamate desuccinylase [Marinobacter zhejiangensis]SFL81646.1 succinylglutamate desuccinylase [Marinobacter zhejiangensis]
MTPRQRLFGADKDWLAHTLDQANASSPELTLILADGCAVTLLDTGILRLVPAKASGEDPRLIVSAGIHGNETAPIEVLNQLVTELLDGLWSLATPTLLILGNPPAMAQGERFIEFNMNRLFAGAHEKRPYHDTPEGRRARELEQACLQFRNTSTQLVHYDLHTAIRPSIREKFALYPFVPERRVPPEQCAFLLEAGVETLLLQHKTGTTFSSFTSVDLGAESFTIELGKVRPFGQNDLSRFAAVEQALRRLMRGDTPPDNNGGQIVKFEVVHEIINTGDQFHFHVPDDVANFTSYEPGTLIWHDDRNQYKVGDLPESVVFPNRDVPIGQRVGLMIRPLADE